MSDLISRSTAMENYCNALCPKLQKGEYCNNCIVKAWLNNQPTAYDIDKVVEQLEKASWEETDISTVIYIDEAIEIVKQEAEKFGTDTNVWSNGWIPCSVRIPTEQERWFGHDLTDAEPREFIVMVKGAYEPTTGYYHSGYGCWVKDLTSEYDDKNTGYGNEIVAWRFLPQPYQPKGE